MKQRIQHWLQHSLATRLTLLVLLATLCAWLSFGAVLLHEARKETAEVLDRQLTAYADMLWQNLGDEDDLKSSTPQEHSKRTVLAFTLHHDDGNLLISSQKHPFPRQAGASKHPYSIEHQGRTWQITVRQDHERQLIVGEPQQNQHKIAQELSEHLFETALWALLILLPLLYFAIRQGLKPLNIVTAELAQREPNNLNPLDAKVPSEIRPLRDRLNTLFAQVSDTLARERRFTADAAHELRTPLAGLRVQIELAQSSPRIETREKALGKALIAVDRTTRLVAQLLALARLEHGESPSFEAISLPDLAKTALIEAQLPVDTAHLSIQNPVHLIGQPILLGLLLRNILDNAQQYAGVAANIQITIDGAILRITDDGKGVSEEDLARLSERFYRPAGQSQPGAGLGLSIVRRIAELHQAQLHFSNQPAGGFCVELIFKQEMS
ncbi:ATP-binding protein [Deefgea rivuli]|uniref:ATP-binding protein n=1 Tax=Deefgea rivuli TaxID=400948 RepID=UPI000684E9EF|nr:ATP-binding protein [Deefgea rivuli]